jgi:hypothetical protein
MTDAGALDAPQVYVREVVGGPYCGGADEGRILADYLLKVWARYRRIRVSFRGIDVVEFPFCWALAQAVVQELGPDGAAGKLEITSLSERGQYLLGRAMAFAARAPEGPPDADSQA